MASTVASPWARCQRRHPIMTGLGLRWESTTPIRELRERPNERRRRDIGGASVTDTDFEVLISDASKLIEGDIAWSQSEDRAPWLHFRVEVASEVGWPLFVVGSYNPSIHTLSYVLILQTTGRIYALDMGKDHHNPQCDQVGELHKHRWSEALRDKEAYVPTDITKPASGVVGVWEQFCTEARLHHEGRMAPPPPIPTDLFA